MNDYDTEALDVTSVDDRALDASADHDGGRHPLNIGHLVMGIVFAMILVMWGLWHGDLITTVDARWLMPLPWLLAGAAGLIAIALTGRRRRG